MKRLSGRLPVDHQASNPQRVSGSLVRDVADGCKKMMIQLKASVGLKPNAANSEVALRIVSLTQDFRGPSPIARQIEDYSRMIDCLWPDMHRPQLLPFDGFITDPVLVRRRLLEMVAEAQAEIEAMHAAVGLRSNATEFEYATRLRALADLEPLERSPEDDEP